MKKQKGITLIALILTIIIMLILVGVTIGTVRDGLMGKTKDITIQTSLEMVDTAIKMYKTEKMTTGMMETVDNNTLIQNGILKEYVIEETLRPIAVVEDYLKLRIAEDFGAGYKDIEASGDGYIATLKELENVCAIDLTDGTLYYLDRGKIYSLDGKTEIANNFERVNADLDEWTFNESTKTLTAYNWDLTQIRGQQQEGELIIPNYYNGIRVVTLGTDNGNGIFKNNSDLVKLTISSGIQSINRYVFQDCSNLKGDLILPDSITSINVNVFAGCRSLDGKLKLSNNIKSIGASAFSGCSSLKGDLTLPDSLTSMQRNVFYSCASLDGKLEIGEGLTDIPIKAFAGCGSLQGDLIIPDNVKTIGESAFLNCKSLDGNLVLSSNLTGIGLWAFRGCSKLSGNIIIPENITTIGTWTFDGCSRLESIKFLNATTSITDSSATIAANVKILGYAGSTAEAYAMKYNRTFEVIE